MKISYLNSIFIACLLLTTLVSCPKYKMKPKNGGASAKPAGGIYILNQGDFYNAPGSLTYYNMTSKTLVPDPYSAAKGKQITDGKDIAIYGSKMYVVGSGIDVADSKTARLIKHINFSGGHIAFYKGDAFVTGNDSTVAIIDTATLTITKSVNIGCSSYPEGLALANDKLYVATPGPDAGGNDTISVLDLNMLIVITTINVIHGPIGMAADADGHIIVLSPFDDKDFASPFAYIGGMTVIDSQTDNVVFTSQAHPPLNNYSSIPITVRGDFAFYFNANNKLMVFNTKTHACGPFVKDNTSFTNPSCLAVNTVTGEVFVGDANNTVSNGSLYAFDNSGKLEYKIATGINPAQIALM